MATACVGTEDLYAGPPAYLASWQTETETHRETILSLPPSEFSEGISTGPLSSDSASPSEIEEARRLPQHHPNESFRAEYEMYLPDDQVIDETDEERKRERGESILFESNNVAEDDEDAGGERFRADTIPFEDDTGLETGLIDSARVSVSMSQREELLAKVVEQEWTGLCCIIIIIIHSPK